MGQKVAEGVLQEISHQSGFLHGNECCIDTVFVLFGRVLKCKVCREKIVRQTSFRPSTV